MGTHRRRLALLTLCLTALLALDTAPARGDERRGSRVLAYYRQLTLRPGGGVLGSAFTLIQVTNGDPSLAASLRFVLIDAATCVVNGPFTVPLGAGRVVRLDVAAFAPSSAEGIMDLWAVDSMNRPILFNLLTADSTIADLALPAVMQVDAEILPFDSVNMGDVAPTRLRGNFFQLTGVQHRLVLMRPVSRAQIGTAMPSSTSVDLYTPLGTLTASQVRSTSCISTGNLATVAPTGFLTQFADGGTVAAQNAAGAGPPIVGWLFHVIPVPFANPGGALTMGVKLHTETVGLLPQ